MQRIFFLCFALAGFFPVACTRNAVDVGEIGPDSGTNPPSSTGGAGGVGGGSVSVASGGSGGGYSIASELPCGAVDNNPFCGGGAPGPAVGGAGGSAGVGGATPNTGGSAGMAAGGTAGGAIGGSYGYGGVNEMNCELNWVDNGYCGGAGGTAVMASGGSAGAATMAAGGVGGGSGPSPALGGAGGQVTPGVLGETCDLGFQVGPSQAAFDAAATDCQSKICLKPVDQVGGVDTSALCTQSCGTDADCAGLLRNPADPSDKRCVSGYTCGIPFVKGTLCCRHLCICKDFTGGPVPVPIACQGSGTTCT